MDPRGSGPGSAGPFDLEGQVAVVTGGGNGIGRAVAIALGGCGARVVVGDVDAAALQRLTDTWSARHEPLPVVTDVGDPGDVGALFDAAVESFGRLDVAVASAGRLYRSRLQDVSCEEWDEALRVNLRGTMLTCQAAAHAMEPGGRIVTIASTAARNPASVTGLAYAVAKAGVVHLTKAAAHELAGRGINVNAVAPAAVATSMSAVFGDALDAVRDKAITGALATPEQVADAVLFLVSGMARYVTGHVLDLTGGSFIP